MPSFQQQYPLSGRKFWKKLFSRGKVSGYSRRHLGLGPSLIAIIIILIYISYTVPGATTAAPTYAYNAVLGSNSPAFYLWIAAEVLAGVFVLYVLLKAWYVATYIHRYFYDAAPDAITIRKGVFTSNEIHVPWDKVQDVYVDQDMLDRMLGLYDVHLASTTLMSGVDAHIDGVDKAVADGLKTYLLAKIATPTL